MSGWCCMYPPPLLLNSHFAAAQSSPPSMHTPFLECRKGTVVLQGGVSNERLVLYAPPDKTVSVLMNETGCVTCLDFSTDGRLLVSGACHAR